MNHRNLLVISNDQAWSSETAAYLRQFNYNVVTSSDCVEAFWLAKQKAPDCLLIDSCLQEMTGAELVMWARIDAIIKKIPIILANDGEEKELKACLDSGINGFFLKSWPQTEIFSVVENFLRRVDWDRCNITHNDLRLDGVDFQVYRNSRHVAKLPREQFRLLYLLIDKTPRYVSEAEIARYVFQAADEENKKDAIRGLAQRLRVKLGKQLGRRIKTKVSEGWAYFPTRVRNPRKAPPTNTD